MMKLSACSFLLSIALTVVACNSDNKQPVGNGLDLDVIRPDTLCFESYGGLQNQDTASIELILKGGEVSGKFSNFPYQKDKRVGLIRGTRTGDMIKGIWEYQQEGITDSINFEFKLQDSALLQKETRFNPATGKETLDQNCAFNKKFLRLNCG